MFRSAAGLTVVACLLLSPVAALTLGVAILPFSWPFLATVPVMLLISLPLSHGGILGSWWRTLPPPRAMYWLLADFATLSWWPRRSGGCRWPPRSRCAAWRAWPTRGPGSA